MSLRLFAAIPMPDDIAERLVALQRGVPGATWRPKENLHLTLRFFGEIAEPEADDLDAELSAIAHRAKAFEVRLKGAGVFGRGDPHALWIGVDAVSSLFALADGCERAARKSGLKPERRKFAPHVTLAHLRNPDRERVIRFEQRLALYESDPWRVEAFALYSSHVRHGAPSLFQVEAEYPLR
jgi:2'-5' RNA ligase